MLRSARLFFLPTLLLVHVVTASAEEKLWLAKDRTAQATIVGGGEDDYAVGRLRRWFSEQADVEVDVVAADAEGIPKQGCIILLGSAASNPLIAKLDKQLELELDPAGLTEQGYVAKLMRAQRTPVVDPCRRRP